MGFIRTLLAVVLACCLMVMISPAVTLPAGETIDLPTTPPEVDDTPIQPVDPPSSVQEEIPLPPTAGEETVPVPEAPPPQSVPDPETATYDVEELLTTESVLLLGLVLWYALTLVGIVGGRSPRHPRERSL